MTTTQATESRPYGLWPSPISPQSLAQGKRLSDVAFDSDGETLVWLEGRSDRGVLVAARFDDPAPRDLTTELSVRATVGYGGGDFTVAHGSVYFASGGRLYRQALSGGAAQPLTPAFGAAAAPAVSPDGRWVLYVHSYEETDTLALVDTEGMRWPLKVAEGRDFFMQPRWHPAGDRIAWVAWDHPNMPWDGTELWLAEIDLAGDQPRAVNPRRVAGDDHTAVFQPEFSPDGRLLAYAADPSGWGNLFLHDLTSGETRQLTTGTGEYSRPAWAQGRRSYCFRGDTRIVASRSIGGFDQLESIDLSSGAASAMDGPMTAYGEIEALAGRAGANTVALIASGPAQSARVVTVDLGGAVSEAVQTGHTVWARATGETVPTAALSRPEALSWTSFDGDEAFGLFYPPCSERFRGEGLPPLVVLVHGGPTSQATAAYSAQSQFLATRGYAVLAVNHRGSTGYGRAYMEKLRGAWGVYDVEDSLHGARALAERGLVDPTRRAIMGGSAGGYTVWQSLVSYPGFYTAAVCLYGISNQFALAMDTHKFEARYSDSLLGALPAAAALYRERSPLFHAARISDPVAVFQGADDVVVPKSQSDEIVASLRSRGVPHEYHIYEGEGHGFRKTETIAAFYSAVDRFLRQYLVFA